MTAAVDLFFFLKLIERTTEGIGTVFVKSEQEQSAIFAERFLRAYRLLDFIACRVLCDEQRAHIAIDNCWRRASRNPPRFEYEGAFRSWLIRVLINEALAIRGQDQETNTTTLDTGLATSSPSGVVKWATFPGGTQ